MKTITEEACTIEKQEDGTYGAILVGGPSIGTAGAPTELEAAKQLVAYLRDLLNARNDELRRVREVVGCGRLGCVADPRAAA